ncbi:MAG: MBL fold metallo-hydrolase [Acidobacteria bacterium]|nr:MAG: MBL fold metallo-hydrolase [Acidobacteriota bacterium]
MAQRYSNQDPEHLPNAFKDVLRWSVLDRLTGKRRRNPPGPPAPSVRAELSRIDTDNPVPRLTWIGHASFLASFGARHFLLDAVFSNKIATVVPRHCPPGLRPGQLPHLAASLVSHGHYDHLDKPSIRALPAAVPVVVPLGLGSLVRGCGRQRVIELDWWESIEFESERVTLVPSRHWSRRGLTDTNRTLWGGYVIETDAGAVYHAGDSGWFDGFAAIGERFPGLLAAMLPIGGYDPAWFMEKHHLNPEQAGRAFLALGARHLVPMHWGTFRLTDEPLIEPVERIRRWWDARQLPGKRLHCLSVGETIRLEETS